MENKAAVEAALDDAVRCINAAMSSHGFIKA